MSRKLFKTFLTMAVIAAVAALASTGRAATLYDTDFNEYSTGNPPSDWVQVSNVGTLSETEVKSGLLGDPNYFNVEQASGEGGSAQTWALDPDEHPESLNWQDYTVSTRVNTNFANARTGLLARWDEADSEGYWAYYNVTDTSDNYELVIGKGAATGYAEDTELVQETGNGIGHSNDIVHLTFEVEGDNLTATLYEDNSGSMGNMLKEASVTDSDYAAGGAGVRASFPTDGRRSRYDTFTVVPEPGSLVLLGLGGLLLMKRRRL